MKYPLKFGKQENLMTYFYNYATVLNTIKKMDETVHSSNPTPPKKGNPRISKNYRDETLTAKVYNTLLLEVSVV